MTSVVCRLQYLLYLGLFNIICELKLLHTIKLDSKGPSTLLVLVLQPVHTKSKYTDPHAPKPGEQLK
jgi:hypothetical protein